MRSSTQKAWRRTSCALISRKEHQQNRLEVIQNISNSLYALIEYPGGFQATLRFSSWDLRPCRRAKKWKDTLRVSDTRKKIAKRLCNAHWRCLREKVPKKNNIASNPHTSRQVHFISSSTLEALRATLFPETPPKRSNWSKSTWGNPNQSDFTTYSDFQTQKG